LCDTAGIRETAHAVEAIGVEQARQSLLDADACLLVVDSTKGWTAADEDLLSLVPNQLPSMIVMNKCDLHEASAPDGRLSVIDASAETGDGLDNILQWLAHALVPNVPPPDQPLPLPTSLFTALTAVK